MQSPGSVLLRLWRRLRPLPFGTWLFARIFGRLVPYSGSVRPRILVLEPGHAEVEIFSEHWWSRPGEEVLETCIERHCSVV